MADKSKLKSLAKVGGGVIAGLLTNFVWTKYRLPGYGHIAFKIGKRDDDFPLDMGYDDVAQLGIGTIWIQEDFKSGAGFILGTMATKFLEKIGYTPETVADWADR